MASIETFRGVAHPWLCDVMGHLNTRHFMAMFDDASMHYLSALGFDFADAKAGKTGWADVKIELELSAEVPKGALVQIRSFTKAIGNSSLTYISEMLCVSGETLHARATTKTVYFDLKARKSLTLPENFKAAASALLADDQ